MQLNLLPTIQQAIANLLTVYEPEFLRFGYSLFLSFATILIVWQGVKMMFSHDNLGDSMFDFAKLLMLISFGYAFIAFYEAPIPGIGVSFSNLITDQTGYFQSVLEARAFDNVYRHFDELSDHFLQPDAWSILANLIYWAMLLLIALAKGLSLAVIAFGLIASAVCGLLGPIFVPFFIVPKLEWLFWGWLKSFIQYSFVPVVAIAFLMIFEQFVFRYVTTLPPTITSAEYGVYGLQAVAVVVTFCIGIALVPSLTSSIFSGQGGQSILSSVPRLIRMR
ncbi:MAG TPA: type IV secretion system protein [Vicinamibacterales bacterium]|nr:type IV secretion system protein [Vicinamibacterales bacterium]